MSDYAELCRKATQMTQATKNCDVAATENKIKQRETVTPYPAEKKGLPESLRSGMMLAHYHFE